MGLGEYSWILQELVRLAAQAAHTELRRPAAAKCEPLPLEEVCPPVPACRCDRLVAEVSHELRAAFFLLCIACAVVGLVVGLTVGYYVAHRRSSEGPRPANGLGGRRRGRGLVVDC